MSLDYRAAGVDLAAAEEAKRRIRRLVESTYTDGVRGAFGAFGGMFRVPPGVRAPILVASADGVGTKLQVAAEAERYDTVGHCLVNHCVNDILAQGAVPLFFLDYVAFGVLVPAVLEQIVSGLAAGCRENGCALLGGETAEMPTLYTPPDFDLAGFIVGMVDETAVIGPERVRAGDLLVALESNGLHTNGYSLARRIVKGELKLSVHAPFPGLGMSTADALLAVHRSYLGVLRSHLASIHAMAHITGGGIPGNLNRALPATLDARVDTRSWSVPPLFETIVAAGRVQRDEAFRVFNMGVGMIVIVDRSDADRVVSAARTAGIGSWVAGDVVPGAGYVHLV